MDIINEIETRASADMGTIITLNQTERDTAMSTWLHSAWDTAVELQRGDDDNGVDFTLRRGTINWNPAGTSVSITADDVGMTTTLGTTTGTLYDSLGFQLMPGWNADQTDEPTGFLKAILQTDTCFPWLYKNLVDNDHSKYIIVLDGKIYRYMHDETSNPKVNTQKLSAAKNAVKDYATAEYHNYAENEDEADARTTAGNTTITNNTGDF